MVIFKEMYKEWFASKCKCTKRTTADRIEVTWNRYYLGSEIIDMCISNISEKDIITFYQKLISINGTLKQKDMERITQIMRGVLTYARDMEYKGVKLYDWDLVRRNIPQSKINHEKKVETALSKEIVSKIINSVIVEDIYPQKKSACMAICLNFYLGLRIGELSALKFEDFNIQDKTVTIKRSDSKSYERDENGERVGTMNYESTTPKTIKSVRTIPLLPEAIYIYEVIKTYHQNCKYNSQYLVYDNSDTVRLRSLDRTLRRLCILNNIEPFGSHRIRKTFASMLHNNNVPTRAIADLMGHEEIRTTENNYILSFMDNQETYKRYMAESLRYN